MRRKNKKSQLSFFILIGFVILFIMGFVYYVAKQAVGYKTKKENLEAQEVTFDISSIKSYVTACLKKTADDGIRLLGEQGGRIYISQGGIFNHTDYLRLNNSIDIGYGLILSNFSTYECSGSTPSFFCNNTIGIYSTYVTEGTFKGNPYPWLNFPMPLRRNCTDRRGCFGKEILPTLDLAADSMYFQLQVYIKNKIESCTNFSIFENQGFSIEKNGSIVVNVTTAVETVVAVLEYPLEIVDPTTKKQTRLEDFYYDTKVRLRLMHQIAKDIVTQDRNNESFNVNQFSYDRINVNILRMPDQIINPSEDNIVKIEDHFSGIPFVFQFGRKNRAPVLGNIPSPITIDKDYKFNDTYFDRFMMYDPDETTPTKYYYSSELAIGSVSSPVKLFDNKNLNTVGCGNNFKINVCVSDRIDPQACTNFDSFRDWQEVEFHVSC